MVKNKQTNKQKHWRFTYTSSPESVEYKLKKHCEKKIHVSSAAVCSENPPVFFHKRGHASRTAAERRTHAIRPVCLTFRP